MGLPVTTSPTDLINKIVSFINRTGIDCRAGKLPGDTFLPGISICNGSLLFDSTQSFHPGDLLHEAGHLAVLLPHERILADGSENISGAMDPGAAEMAAIAWSWAAKEYLQIPPEVLFHENGYKDGSQTLIDNFSAGKYFGVPTLQYIGMTTEPGRDGAVTGPVYPEMRYWLRQEK